MLKLLGHIERYCQLAADELPFKIADLKLSELRTSLRKHDAEMAIVGARFVRESLQPGVAVMQEKGLEPRKIEELDRLMEDIRVQNIEQNELMNERRRQVEDNMNLMNDFWLLLQDLMRTGKLIHQDNPVRKAEYTEKNIRSSCARYPRKSRKMRTESRHGNARTGGGTKLKRCCGGVVFGPPRCCFQHPPALWNIHRAGVFIV
jgi:hypothetical protein